ncbi:MAG: hypothetical protein EXS16_19845 [Gemmataceae bacterium]|nr:hypothetical protein [Gemmataceae bacterium]
MIDDIQSLLADDRLYDLGQGSPNIAAKTRLQAVASQVEAKAENRDFAAACMAGLWLLHDFHDASHAISQDLDTVEGSYWHAILHRREPDYWNAKYWFRRVPGHPTFTELAKQAEALTREAGTPAGCEYLLKQKAWDSHRFVDLCETAARGPDALAMLCRRIQQAEWRLLFMYCRERAF